MKRSSLYVLGCSMLIMLSFLCTSQPTRTQSQETTNGRKRVALLNKQKLSDVQALIKQSEDMIEANKIPQVSMPDMFEKRYRNALIMGDSIAEALLDYDLLSRNSVVAKRGRRVDIMDEDIEIASTLRPSVIFLEYGLNDLEYYGTNDKRFIQVYASKLDKLKQRLPDASIYVLSILPMTQQAQKETPKLKRYELYNRALRTMCQNKNVSYVDMQVIVEHNKIVYEADGIHPQYPFYPIWLRYLMQIAKL